MTIVGARPQFIKCAPLSRAIRKTNEEILVHTGQHYDFEMSRIFFEELEIPEPDYNLNVGSGSHGAQTAKILSATEDVLLKEEPDMVIVFGDTNSTLAGSIAASKLHIPVSHVEAGLRSYDRTMPEEINRVLTDHASDLLFTPTRKAVSNLRKEGISVGVYNVGDVMVDALESARGAIGKSTILERLGLHENEYAMMTVHRASNTDDPARLAAILKAMSDSGRKVVFPIHPRTRKAVETAGLETKLTGNIIAIPPVGYVDSLRLMSGSDAVITDSGGMQKEAFLLKKRCITLRENTEWPETLRGGMNTLVGADEKRILAALNEKKRPGRTSGSPFGEPGAAERISIILDRFGASVSNDRRPS
ncbi:MAG: UDP-N-acetylglucosamine 2-epimerase (non-hydrolyzing) [Methanomassiliicoccales archaeon]